MERMGDGVCRASVEVENARHTYKFVVDGQWIADQKPGSVAPVAGSKERYEVIQLLNWTSSEMHASVGPLFNKSLSDEIKDYALKKYLTKLQYANDNIAAGKDYVVGNDFTIADSVRRHRHATPTTPS
jgi:beta-lactamase class D